MESVTDIASFQRHRKIKRMSAGSTIRTLLITIKTVARVKSLVRIVRCIRGHERTHDRKSTCIGRTRCDLSTNWPRKILRKLFGKTRKKKTKNIWVTERC